MAFCTNCGNPVKEKDRFCGKCGRMLTAPGASDLQSKATNPAQTQDRISDQKKSQIQASVQAQEYNRTVAVPPVGSSERKKKSILLPLLLSLLGVGLVAAGIIFVPGLLKNSNNNPQYTLIIETSPEDNPETGTTDLETETTADPDPMRPAENKTFLRENEFVLYPYETYQPGQFTVAENSHFTIVGTQALLEYQLEQEAVKISRDKAFISPDGRAGIIRLQLPEEEEGFLYYDGEEIFALPRGTAPQAISWDGASLFYGQGSWRYRGQIRELVPNIVDPLFSPDGQTLAWTWAGQYADSGAGSVLVQLLDWQQSEPKIIPLPAYPVALSNKGEILFYYDNISYNLYAYEQESGSTRLLTNQLAGLPANENNAYLTREMKEGLFIDGASGSSYIWEKGGERRSVYPQPLYPLEPSNMAYDEYGSQGVLMVMGFESFKNRLYYTAPVTEGDKSLVDIVYLDEAYHPMMVRAQVEVGLVLSSDGQDCWFEEAGQIYLLSTDNLWKGSVEILHRGEAWEGWRDCFQRDGKGLLRIVDDGTTQTLELWNREGKDSFTLKDSYKNLAIKQGGARSLFMVGWDDEKSDLYTLTPQGPVLVMSFVRDGARRHLLNDCFVGVLSLIEEDGISRVEYRLYKMDEAGNAQPVSQQTIPLKSILIKEDEPG